MQTIGAYIIFMIALVAFGLSIIMGGVLLIVLCEGAIWLWTRLHFRQTLRSHSVLAHR